LTRFASPKSCEKVLNTLLVAEKMMRMIKRREREGESVNHAGKERKIPPFCPLNH